MTFGHAFTSHTTCYKMQMWLWAIHDVNVTVAFADMLFLASTSHLNVQSIKSPFISGTYSYNSIKLHGSPTELYLLTQLVRWPGARVYWFEFE